MSTFEEADKKVHKVEDQWHFKYLTKYGFEPIDKEGIGFPVPMNIVGVNMSSYALLVSMLTTGLTKQYPTSKVVYTGVTLNPI